jgi:hypothetical protein
MHDVTHYILVLIIKNQVKKQMGYNIERLPSYTTSQKLATTCYNFF